MGTTHEETPETFNTNKRYSGKVKWFNNKAGYGFITLNSNDPVDAELNNTDIFVHHSVINVKKEQYKYLVQGEYVEFSLISAKKHHKYHASDISGVGGGTLLCESMKPLTLKVPPKNESVHGGKFIGEKRGRRPENSVRTTSK
jgi:cold shock CspA family protein